MELLVLVIRSGEIVVDVEGFVGSASWRGEAVAEGRDGGWSEESKKCWL